MSTLLILIGLPASGKSTYAASLGPEWVRSNRDMFRSMMFSVKDKTVLDFSSEKDVTVAQRASVMSLLDSGKNVVLDDTNLRSRYVTEWITLAHSAGHTVDFKVFNIDVPELVERNNKREDRVPESAIVNLAARFIRKGRVSLDPWALYDKVQRKSDGPALEKYVPDTSKPTCAIVDLDGTLANNNSGRGFYDWERVYEDDVSEAVLEIVNGLKTRLDKIVFMSGRDEVCRTQTENWLRDKVGWDSDIELHMRPHKDNREDSEVKLELFDKHIRNKYNAVLSIDDRNQVVKLWRALGIVTAQVAEGAF